MRPIVIRSAGADEIARAWGDLRRVDRQRKGSEVMLDVSALTEASAAFEAFVVALDIIAIMSVKRYAREDEEL